MVVGDKTAAELTVTVLSSVVEMSFLKKKKTLGQGVVWRNYV